MTRQAYRAGAASRGGGDGWAAWQVGQCPWQVQEHGRTPA
jgi:hypothetical protein